MSTMDSLLDHAGYLGMFPIIAIHADWPTYPRGIGWEIALKNMASFPKGTFFYKIDDIDQCVLFIDQDPRNIKGDVFEYQNYHLATWHEDLIYLKKMGYIQGCEAINFYQWELDRFKIFCKVTGITQDAQGNIPLSYKGDDGIFRPHIYKRPKPSDCDVFYNDFPKPAKEWVRIKSRIRLTPLGFTKIGDLSNKIILEKKIAELVNPILDLGRFDTAIREAVLLVESNIKSSLKSNNYGQKLIDEHIKYLVKKNSDRYSAVLKTYRSELRCLFRFVRNDFMHNFKRLDVHQTKIILGKISEIYSEVLEVLKVYK